MKTLGSLSLALALNAAAVHSVQAGSSTNTGPMTAARAYGNFPQDIIKILLSNGKVLVMGGWGPYDTQINDSPPEVYDPSNGTWTLAPMNVHRVEPSFTTTLLPDGRVLVAGGYWTGTPMVLSSAELFDPATGTWTNTGSMSVARTFHAATILPNGKPLVCGGWNIDHTGNPTNIPSVELYDPATGTWTTNGYLNTPRSEHAAISLANGKVLVIGGVDITHLDPQTGGYLSISSAELYDPSTGTATAIVLTNTTKLSNGSFQLAFTNTTGASFTTLATTNPAVPLSNWTTLGNPTEISPGHFQFTDTQATNNSKRFYRIRSP
jgi:hypothetical protein